MLVHIRLSAGLDFLVVIAGVFVRCRGGVVPGCFISFHLGDHFATVTARVVFLQCRFLSR